MSAIKVISVNISEKKGTIKKPVETINLTERGVEHDAHAGDWHRQVSLLGKESIEKFESVLGRMVNLPKTLLPKELPCTKPNLATCCTLEMLNWKSPRLVKNATVMVVKFSAKLANVLCLKKESLQKY